MLTCSVGKYVAMRCGFPHQLAKLVGVLFIFHLSAFLLFCFLAFQSISFPFSLFRLEAEAWDEEER